MNAKSVTIWIELANMAFQDLIGIGTRIRRILISIGTIGVISFGIFAKMRRGDCRALAARALSGFMFLPLERIVVGIIVARDIAGQLGAFKLQLVFDYHMLLDQIAT